MHINAGAITGTALLPDAVAGGGTSAFVAEGATVTASGLNVQAEATNTATVTPVQISAGAISGSYANPQASTSQDVEAYIGPAYGESPNLALAGTINVGNGTVTVNAQSTKNQATVNEVNIMAGAITLAYMHPQATIGGSTRAHIGGKFGITASAVERHRHRYERGDHQRDLHRRERRHRQPEHPGGDDEPHDRGLRGHQGQSHAHRRRARAARDLEQYGHGGRGQHSGGLRHHRVRQVGGERRRCHERLRPGGSIDSLPTGLSVLANATNDGHRQQLLDNLGRHQRRDRRSRRPRRRTVVEAYIGPAEGGQPPISP